MSLSVHMSVRERSSAVLRFFPCLFVGGVLSFILCALLSVVRFVVCLSEAGFLCILLDSSPAFCSVDRPPSLFLCSFAMCVHVLCVRVLCVPECMSPEYLIFI